MHPLRSAVLPNTIWRLFMNTFVSRRVLLSGTGKVALSAGAIALLSGNQALAASKGAKSSDVGILNVALALEHEAIAAYQIGAESGLLQSGVLAVAVSFQSHHKAHRDALAGTCAELRRLIETDRQHVPLHDCRDPVRNARIAGSGRRCAARRAAVTRALWRLPFAR